MLNFRKTQHLIRNPPLEILLRGDRTFELPIIDNPPFNSIDQQHPTRLQSPLLNNLVGIDGNSTDFRSTNHHVVRRNVESTRTKTVTIEISTAVPSVGECEQCGTVPGFHLTSCPLIEGFLVGIHEGVV